MFFPVHQKKRQKTPERKIGNGNQREEGETPKKILRRPKSLQEDQEILRLQTMEALLKNKKESPKNNTSNDGNGTIQIQQVQQEDPPPSPLDLLQSGNKNSTLDPLTLVGYEYLLGDHLGQNIPNPQNSQYNFPVNYGQPSPTAQWLNTFNFSNNLGLQSQPLSGHEAPQLAPSAPSWQPLRPELTPQILDFGLNPKTSDVSQVELPKVQSVKETPQNVMSINLASREMENEVSGTEKRSLIDLNESDGSLATFMAYAGLSQFTCLLSEAWVDFTELSSLREEDFMQIGLPLGASKKLMRSLRRWQGMQRDDW